MHMRELVLIISCIFNNNLILSEFHAHCVDTWLLDKSNTCPLCKKKVDMTGSMVKMPLFGVQEPHDIDVFNG